MITRDKLIKMTWEELRDHYKELRGGKCPGELFYYDSDCDFDSLKEFNDYLDELQPDEKDGMEIKVWHSSRIEKDDLIDMIEDEQEEVNESELEEKKLYLKLKAKYEIAK